MSRHFQFIPTGSDYRRDPLADRACRFVAHCRKHGDNLTYPTLDAAEEARRRMDIAIENRGGRPWRCIGRGETQC